MAALLAAGPAYAADQAPILKAPPAAIWSWSGFYLCGHGGYGWGRDTFSNLNDHDPFFDIFFSGKFPNFVTTGFDSKGLLGGFQAGANWQSGAIVGGLEIDLSGTDIKGSKTTLPAPVGNPLGLSTATWTNSDKFALLGSGRARLGYVAWPNVLLYGTGGLAWTRLDQTTDVLITSINPAPPPTSNSVGASSVIPSWRFGWVAGIGGEARISDTNWLVRLEYLHYDFGDSDSFSDSASSTSVIGGRLTADVVRAGLSYKFEGGIPYAAASAFLSWLTTAEVEFLAHDVGVDLTSLRGLQVQIELQGRLAAFVPQNLANSSKFPGWCLRMRAPAACLNWCTVMRSPVAF